MSKPKEGARATGLPRRVRPLLFAALFAAVVGGSVARFVSAGPAASGSGGARQATASASRAVSTADRITDLEAKVQIDPRPTLLTQLGSAYLTRARETADPAFFALADKTLERSRALAPEDPTNLTALGLVQLALHDFTAALETGHRAVMLAPQSAAPIGVVFDALIELGRYDEAAVAAQEMVDLRPSLASLARVSYLRELHGDARGAVEAMVAAEAAGGSAADLAYVQTLLGDLHLSRGRLDDARSSYRRSLSTLPGYPPANVGLARADADAGRLEAAATRLRREALRLPLPGTVILLGDVLERLGRSEEAATQYGVVRTIETLNRANGVAVDLDLARFEADHARDQGRGTGALSGSAIVELARAAAAARPTVYGEDALAWALRQAGDPAAALPHARAAVRLGTADATLWWHLAAIEADLGLLDAARSDLAHAFVVNPNLNVHDLPAARALAQRLELDSR